MSINARFVHINIVTKDIQKLIKFYEKVFGCKETDNKRELKGKWFEEATGIPKGKVKSTHLLMPGYDDNGPTMEIFEFDSVFTGNNKIINSSGLTHIAFLVDDVDNALSEVIAYGGSQLGEKVTTEIPSIGAITFVYAKDPDDNIIELQYWTK